MLALLSRRFRRYLILMIAVPVLGRVLAGAGQRLEASRGPGRVSGGLSRSGDTLARMSRGPLRPKGAPAESRPR